MKVPANTNNGTSKVLTDFVMQTRVANTVIERVKLVQSKLLLYQLQLALLTPALPEVGTTQPQLVTSILFLSSNTTYLYSVDIFARSTQKKHLRCL